MQDVAVDINEIAPVSPLADDVSVPDLVEERRAHLILPEPVAALLLRAGIAKSEGKRK
jgi:hypothetical protein